MDQQTILPDFQAYLLKKGLVAENKVSFYAFWASRFLAYNNGHEDLTLDVRIGQFLCELQAKKPLADWQVRQAEEAVRLYVVHFLSGKTTRLSPNTPPSQAPMHDRQELLSKVRELIRLKHYSYSTERTYLDWIHRFFRFLDSTGRTTLSGDDMRDYLGYLALQKRVSASTQNQAFNALLFLYRDVLKQSLDGIEAILSMVS